MTMPTQLLRSPLALALLALAVLGGCSDPKKKAEERQRAIDEARATRAKDADAPPEKAADSRPKDPFWEASELVPVVNEKQCPEGLWAIFPGPAPGGDTDTRAANEAKRAELAKQLRERRFVARMRGPGEIKLKEYDAPKGHFPLELKGIIDCDDSIGRIAIAFTAPKAIEPPPSALGGGAIRQSIWDAPAQQFTYPVQSMSEAKEFKNKHQFGMEAYVIFKLGSTDVHKKLVKVPKVTRGEVSIGGSTDDFGAGRMVRGEVEATRIHANPGPVVMVESKGR
jgi:hypothetical protein